MPRTGPRRKMVGVKLYDDAIAFIQDLADQETGGNLSEMIRKLIKEAIEARQAKKMRR